MCVCVCVCVWNRLCKYSTMKHRPPIYCPISACVLTQMRPYTLLLSNNFNERKKNKKKNGGLKPDPYKIWLDEYGRCTKNVTPACSVFTGRGRVGIGGRDPFMWQQSGCSNNDVVLALWTGMLAGFLSVYPSAARQWHSMTDIKLSLPQCNNGIRL